MTSSSGKVLLTWQNSESIIEAPTEIRVALENNSTFLDWEGRETKSYKMEPGVMYFVRKPNNQIIAKWKKYSGDIFKKTRKNITINQNTWGQYSSQRIFDCSMTVINPDNLKWNSCNKYVGLSRDSKPTGFNARFSAAFTSSGVDILVEVSDNKHYQNYSKSKLYQGDSIQFAIDSTGHGVTSERVEFQAGLKDKSILWKNFAPPLAGDLPDRYTYAPGEVRFGSVVIEKEPGLLRYKIHVSKDDIYPFSYCHNQPVRFALLVNNNDGKGRDGYLEWGSGIGNGKFPADYGTLTVKIPPKQLFKTTDLNRLNKFASRHIISP